MSGNIDDTRETVNIFPSVIQLSTLLGASSMKRDLIRSVEKIRKTTPNGRPDGWTSSVYTTLFTHDKLHKEAEFKGLTDHILREAEHFAGTLGIDLEHFRLVYKDCWFNIYGWKDGQEIHIHNNSVISGSYYLKIPDGASGLIVHSPVMESMFLPPQSTTNIYNIGYDEIFVEEGLVILFRSNLKHSVKPNPIKRERISISFNFVTEIR